MPKSPVTECQDWQLSKLGMARSVSLLYSVQESITKVLKESARAVGVNPQVRVSPHTCRHTFAHLQLKNGLDLYSLSRLLGHENIAITQRYLEGIRDDQVIKLAQRSGVLSNL